MHEKNMPVLQVQHELFFRKNKKGMMLIMPFIDRFLLL